MNYLLLLKYRGPDRNLFTDWNLYKTEEEANKALKQLVEAYGEENPFGMTTKQTLISSTIFLVATR